MARNFRLSTDILSPIHSDISLNDGSTCSFESPFTPDLDLVFKTPGNVFAEKVQLKNSKKDVSTMDRILKDIKKEPVTSANEEQKFQTTYQQLKQSMDDLFQSKKEDNSILSPISNKEKYLSAENVSCESEKKEQEEKLKASDKLNGASLNFISEYPSRTLTKKSYIKSEEDVSKARREKRNPPLTESQPKEFVKKSVKKSSLESELVKNASNSIKSSAKLSKDSKAIGNAARLKESLTKHGAKGNLDVELGAKGDVRKVQRSKCLGMVSSSTQTCESLLPALLNNLPGMPNEKRTAENLLSKYGRHTNVNPVLNHENKDLSIEKSIQIAVSMELDKVRSLMLDQNIFLMKEMFRLEDMARRQGEVTQYLVSVIEDLVKANKILISKHS